MCAQQAFATLPVAGTEFPCGSPREALVVVAALDGTLTCFHHVKVMRCLLLSTNAVKRAFAQVLR